MATKEETQDKLEMAMAWVRKQLVDGKADKGDKVQLALDASENFRVTVRVVDVTNVLSTL